MLEASGRSGRSGSTALRESTVSCSLLRLVVTINVWWKTKPLYVMTPRMIDSNNSTLSQPSVTEPNAGSFASLRVYNEPNVVQELLNHSFS